MNVAGKTDVTYLYDFLNPRNTSGVLRCTQSSMGDCKEEVDPSGKSGKPSKLECHNMDFNSGPGATASGARSFKVYVAGAKTGYGSGYADGPSPGGGDVLRCTSEQSLHAEFLD